MNDSTAPAGVTRYRNKRIEVEAIQFLGKENCELVHAFLGIEHSDAPCSDLIDINSYGLVQSAAAGDWIVHNADGAYLAFSDEEFHGEFEAVGDNEAQTRNFAWGRSVGLDKATRTVDLPFNDGDTWAGTVQISLDDVRVLHDMLGDVLEQVGDADA